MKIFFLCSGKNLVKSKFLKLNYSHVEYVINCLGKNTTKVRNIKSLKMRQIKNYTNHFEIKINLTLLETGIILGL